MLEEVAEGCVALCVRVAEQHAELLRREGEEVLHRLERLGGEGEGERRGAPRGREAQQVRGGFEGLCVPAKLEIPQVSFVFSRIKNVSAEDTDFLP